MMKKWILVMKSFMLLIMALQDVTTVLAKPASATATAARAATTIATTITEQMPVTKTTSDISKLQPLFEYQLAVWPTDVDDIIEAVMPQNDEMPMDDTLVEQPITIMPDIDFDTQENWADDDDDHDVVYDPSSDLWPTIIGGDNHAKPQDTVIVLENYHHKYGNGSEEYKLVLSNGMVNYQRIDHVLVKGVKKPIQQGYFTVPLQHGTRESFQTTYYKADKHGYQVYKTVKSPRNPAYDMYLQYTKEQDKQIEEKKKKIEKK